MGLMIVTCVLAVLLLAALCAWILMGRDKDDIGMMVKRILDVVIVALAAFVIVCSLKLYSQKEKGSMPLDASYATEQSAENPETAE